MKSTSQSQSPLHTCLIEHFRNIAPPQHNYLTCVGIPGPSVCSSGYACMYVRVHSVCMDACTPHLISAGTHIGAHRKKLLQRDITARRGALVLPLCSFHPLYYVCVCVLTPALPRIPPRAPVATEVNSIAPAEEALRGMNTLYGRSEGHTHPPQLISLR